MNKVLKISIFIVGGAALLALLGFVGSIRSSASCEEIIVHISGQSENNLVEKNDIRSLISSDIGVLVGQPLNQINTSKIENRLTQMPHVRDARVYETIDKKLIIEVHEREPLVRLFDRKGNTALMDSEGNIMPLSDHSTLRLPVITGDFAIDRTHFAGDSLIGLKKADSVRVAIFNYAAAIASDPFWKAQIQQTNITKVGDFMAYPQVGNNTINFGDSHEINEKLNRLRIFYKEAPEKTGWNKYSKINLKFKDQIVCTKK